jgi:predicted N-acyltransferase
MTIKIGDTSIQVPPHMINSGANREKFNDFLDQVLKAQRKKVIKEEKNAVDDFMKLLQGAKR